MRHPTRCQRRSCGRPLLDESGNGEYWRRGSHIYCLNCGDEIDRKRDAMDQERAVFNRVYLEEQSDGADFRCVTGDGRMLVQVRGVTLSISIVDEAECLVIADGREQLDELIAILRRARGSVRK